MTRVGVREHRQRASELLRLVEQGETIEVTDRGRPVALLTPLPEGSVFDRLRAAGELDAATADVADLPPPFNLPAEAELPLGGPRPPAARRALMPDTYLDSSAIVSRRRARPPRDLRRPHAGGRGRPRDPHRGARVTGRPGGARHTPSPPG